jgi:predicted PurR-regulated permease PerM
MNRRVDISWKTILFVTVFLLSLWITYLILDIILLVFVAFIFMSALSPLMDRLVSWRCPKPLAIALLFLAVIGTISGLITIGLSPLVSQTSSLSHRLAETLSGLLQSTNLDRSIIYNQLNTASSQLVGYSLTAFQNLISFISVIVITFYLLLDKREMEGKVASLFVGQRSKVNRILVVIEEKLGAWLRGQLALSLIIGVVTYIGLLALGIEYALPLAILAGLMEVVPVIGPIIAAIPAVLIALTVSPVFAGLVGGFYLAVQQLENHLIVPQVMKRAVGINPLFVILAVSVGGRLLGIGGALLAVPIAVVIQVLVKEILQDDTP